MSAAEETANRFITSAEYEKSADELAKLSTFVVGSATGYKFARFDDDEVHYTAVPKGQELTAEDVAAVDALLATDEMPASFLGELSREDAAIAYTRHYIEHSELRTIREAQESL